MYKVALSNAKTYEAAEGVSLLDAAAAAGVMLEYSCRSGRCGICKAQLLSGETRVLANEESLAPDEAADGFILTCCRAATTDVALDAEDIGCLADIRRQTLPCRIASIRRLSGFVMQIVLRLPPTASFYYVPGQYIDVIARSGVRRSYSIANALREDGCIELLVASVDGGELSRYWFDEAKENDLLRFEGPFGTFFLREQLPGTLIFLATGTGLAPVKAMLEQLDREAAGRQPCKLHFYWGLRAESDISWRPEFSNIDVNFVPVLSRADAAWDGRRGHVQYALAEDMPELSGTAVFACGSPAMIEASRKFLQGLGLSKKMFFSDAFVSST